ncbi:MAG: 30S ribosomal protein S6 [Candidatus Gracilibacteria bacterium]|jgi:small subunit ribosomal protein S6
MTEEIFQKIQKYEIMLILHAEMGEEKTEHELKEIKDLITSNTGEITNEDKWGIRDMCYTIKKQEKGYYVVLNFSMDSLKVKNLEKPLNINQQVLRYIIVRLPEKYELKTLKEYEQERAKEMEDKKKAAQAKEEEKQPQKRTIIRKTKEEEPIKEKKSVKTKEDKPAKEAEPVKEEKEKSPKKKISTESSKSTLDDVDKMLKSIIDDPDITL